MKVLLKVLGVIEIVGGITFIIFFFINTGRGVFEPTDLSLALSCFVSGAVLFYISNLGSRVDTIEDKDILDNRVNDEMIEQIKKLQQRVKVLEAKLSEKQSQESNKE